MNDLVLDSLLMFHLDHPNIFDNSYDFVFPSLEWRRTFLNDSNEEGTII